MSRQLQLRHRAICRAGASGADCAGAGDAFLSHFLPAHCGIDCRDSSGVARMGGAGCCCADSAARCHPATCREAGSRSSCESRAAAGRGQSRCHSGDCRAASQGGWRQTQAGLCRAQFRAAVGSIRQYRARSGRAHRLSQYRRTRWAEAFELQGPGSAKGDRRCAQRRSQEDCPRRGPAVEGAVALCRRFAQAAQARYQRHGLCRPGAAPAKAA